MGDHFRHQTDPPYGSPPRALSEEVVSSLATGDVKDCQTNGDNKTTRTTRLLRLLCVGALFCN